MVNSNIETLKILANSRILGAPARRLAGVPLQTGKWTDDWIARVSASYQGGNSCFTLTLEIVRKFAKPLEGLKYGLVAK